MNELKRRDFAVSKCTSQGFCSLQDPICIPASEAVCLIKVLMQRQNIYKQDRLDGPSGRSISRTALDSYGLLVAQIVNPPYD